MNSGANANIYLDLMAAGIDDPDRPLFHRPEAGDTLSYGDVANRSETMAAALLHKGMVPGDRLVVQVEKSTDAIALWLACLRTGVIFVPLNTAYTDAELDVFVADADTTHLITTPKRGRGLTIGDHGDGTFAELVAQVAESGEPAPPVHQAKPDDPAAMLFTSGTTGRSKGAVLTHRGLMANGRALAEVWEITGDDHLLHTLPVFHVHGLFIALHPLMLQGGQVTFLQRFSPEAVVEHLPRCSVLMGVPTHYTRLLGHDAFTPEAAAGVRLFTSGSAPMTTPLHHRFNERTGRTITERYGMTECGIIASNAPGKPLIGTVGTALPEVQIRIGHSGVVEVEGPHLLQGYWRRPDATAAAYTPDGWFITGDIGTLDADGVLTLSGRASDMIISGGFNIYPKEIEQVLDRDHQIAEAAVVGWPDEEWGERVVAFVVLSESATEETFQPPDLTQLARFKHPRQFVIVPELPRNAMGKVQKTVLRRANGETVE